MAVEPTANNLQVARTLAQELFVQCRESPSSYKLLAGSVKELRNVLEDIEDFLDDPSVLGSTDTRLPDRIARSRNLLEQANSSLQANPSFEHSGIEESAVADLKTDLDLIRKELRLEHDSITSGEITLQLDTSHTAAVQPPSTGLESTSTSAFGSTYERPSSSQASSAWSYGTKDGLDRGIHPGNPEPEFRYALHRGPSQEKEVFDFGAAYLEHSNAGHSAIMPTPSLAWRSPFTDPMSISLEEASTMILKEESISPMSITRPRATTGPTPFIESYNSGSEKPHRPHSPAGLGITRLDQAASNRGLDQDRFEQRMERPRARSESGPAARQSPERSLHPLKASPHRTALSTPELNSYLGSHRQPTSPKEDNFLSPSTTPRSPGRRVRNHSTSSITFSTRSVENGEYTAYEDSRRSAESPRKDLSVVIENPFNDLEELRSMDMSTRKSEESLSRDLTTPTVPPPPSRKAPAAPKERKTPRIPRRSSTYRIVNTSLADDSSSSEEDLYSSSQPTSPVVTKRPPRSPFVELQHDDLSPDGDSSNPENELQSLSNQTMPTYARGSIRITLAKPPLRQSDVPSPPRSAPPFMPKLSTQSLNVQKHPEEGPSPLKRHATSPTTPRDSRTTEEARTVKVKNSPKVPERAATTGPQQRPENMLEDPSAIPTKTNLNIAAQQNAEVVSDKELMPEPGLEIQDWLQVQPLLSSPVSESPTVAGRDLPVSPMEVVSDEEPIPPSNENVVSASTEVSSVTDGSESHQEWYAPEKDTTETDNLDPARIDHITHYWNALAWDSAQRYLEGYLESLLERDQRARARRVRHLIGVCLSYKGNWRAAIHSFLSAIRAPISEISELDDGDCAAAYWLGDLYSLLNQRTEALLAYCIAERSSLFQDVNHPHLCECIVAEQEAVQLKQAKDDFDTQWAQTARTAERQSILDPKIITKSVAKSLIENGPRRPRNSTSSADYDLPFQLDQNKSRSNSFMTLDKLPHVGKYHQLKLTPAHFEPNTTWPMIYDPFFAMANVREGRLLAYECDLVAVFNSNADAKVPKSPMGLSKVDCFTATDLTWLIKTIRECLRMLEMEWSEVSNVEGTWFVVRYSFMMSRIATTHYFSIALFKQSIRSGYGADICPHGICSARIIRTDWEHLKGVHNSEGKRIKKLIREFLDEAAKQQNKLERTKSSVMHPDWNGAAKAARAKLPAMLRPTK